MLYVTGICEKMRKVIKLKSIHLRIYLSYMSQPEVESRSQGSRPRTQKKIRG